ncbi:TolC family protein [Anabaena sp. UHCC 0204]|uniref:TolC family protein n=1 Tax=Anabaena sp. UHCC 0204 TaxID=2590009 RepID=UPI001447A0D2|nr:TolC family protein [Anabaena sp. UHCC 0204]MTJ09591.1 TolC family protein [Anabaena sp. UHCC 0204]
MNRFLSGLTQNRTKVGVIHELPIGKNNVFSYILYNSSLLQTSFLSLLLVFLFPSLGKCQDIPNQQDLPKVNSELQLLLNKPNQDIPLKLIDAVYLALQNNRDLKIAYLQRILDKQQLAETESQFNPTFGTQLSWDFNNNETGSNSSTNKNAALGANFKLKLPTGTNLSLRWQGRNQVFNNSSFSSYSSTDILNQGLNLSLSQPLLRGFGTYLNTLNIKRARLTENTNILFFKNTISQTITNTILVYRNLLLAQERLKIEELSFANAKKELEQLEALFAEGKITKSDLVERQADLAQKEVNLVNVQTNLIQAISDLTKITDLPLKMLIAAEKPAPPTSLDLPTFEEMLKLAQDNNTSYLIAINSVENAKFTIAEAKDQQRLDLRLNVNYGFNSASNSDDTNSVTSSLVLSREFGNLSQDNAVYKSEIALQKANYNLAKTQDDLNEELRNKIRNAKDSFKQIELARLALNLAELRLNNAKEKMKSDSNTSMTDIINFERGLVDAQNQELNAVINHLNSMTQLEQFLGITLNKWIKQ